MNRISSFYLALVAVMLITPVNSYAAVVFADRFEYAVERSDPNARQVFVSNGWSHAKTQQDSPGAKGYLYTVSSIPGFTGRFPGTNSSRVLLMEALPRTLNGQTDFYLQLGQGASAAYDNFIPGDVWIQFWVYPAYYGSQLSQYHSRSKFLYVCNGDYPCQEYQWMVSQSLQSYNPANREPLGNPANGEFFTPVYSVDGVKANDPDNPKDLGFQNLTEWIKPNRWTLFKMHVNTSRLTGNSVEIWLRPQGGAWVKVMEYIGGVTPNFTWDIPASRPRGHRVLRMPTTVGGVSSGWYDSWTYMDDFTIATTERDLPVYSDSGPSPEPPSNVVVE